jgi:hypothetical protein
MLGEVIIGYVNLLRVRKCYLIFGQVRTGYVRLGHVSFY